MVVHIFLYVWFYQYRISRESAEHNSESRSGYFTKNPNVTEL